MPRISGDASDLVARFGLKPEELRFVLSIDGHRSMTELRRAHVVGVEPDAVLAALFITGHLQVEGDEAPLLELDDVFEPTTSIRTKPVLPELGATSTRPEPSTVGLILPKSTSTVNFELRAA